MANLNALSERYVTGQINSIFSAESRILLERDFWILVMEALNEVGADMPLAEIEKYKAARHVFDLSQIKEIELLMKHDVMARLKHFNKVAEAKGAHTPLTSRDDTDNVEQIQIIRAAKIVFGKYISVLRHFFDNAVEYSYLNLCARTHHQPAQMTLLGRRFSMWAEELLHHIEAFERFIENYPLRGIKGPTGTQLDLLSLLGSEEKIKQFEAIMAKKLGHSKFLVSTGQIYPRSLDYELISHLSLLASACANFAITIRLMAGYELMTEGFKKDQVGSSAMPHKMNTRSSERICGAAELLKIYADGASRISGNQWEEGDVSCSIVRRVIIPDSFYASDCVCETTLTVLNEMGSYPAILEKETDKYLPFLATTQFLGMMIKAGMERNAAHKIIKKYAVAEALKMREGITNNNLTALIAEDPDVKKQGLAINDFLAILSDKKHFTGRAKKQIEEVELKSQRILRKYAEEAKYEPEKIL